MNLFLVFFLFLELPNFSPVFSLSPDGLSLLALKSAIDLAVAVAAEDNPFTDWNENDSSPCHWSGVSCMNISGFADPRVVGITVADKNLQGYIPSELGSLVFLRRLNLHGNRLSGPIPVQLFNATSLHSVFLYNNNLSGPLPSEICNLSRIQNLDLSQNTLSGGIPQSFGNCTQLQRLVLAKNNFSGEIPEGIWPKMGNLVQLDLSNNQFSGQLPPDLSQLKSLSGTLNLSFNTFSGKIPESLGKLPVTVSFDLRNNNFTGEIPQTGTFANQGPTAFLHNPGLCGFPLQKPCQNPPSSSPGSRNPAPEPGSSSKKGLKPGLIILISVGDAAGVALIGLIIVYIYWKRKDSNSCSCTGKRKLGGGADGRGRMCICWRGNSDNSSEVDSEKSGDEGGEGHMVAIDKGFTLELDELLRASAYVLGKSSLGIVYKVVLGNGVPVAVRRLGEGGAQRYKEFAAEVQAIARMKHPNIVRLRAYYWAQDEKLLISDFISNGNLAAALRGRTGQPSPSLTWSTRLKIIKGAARGLAHLHESNPRKYVHGDIKPSKILLDADFNPYISDFGLNRLISITGSGGGESIYSSSGYIGAALPSVRPAPSERANNYRAPEARSPGSRPAQKWDVYSFGLVLLETLTGKAPELSSPPTPSSSTSEGVVELVRWVRKGFEEQKPLGEMVDPVLLQEVRAKKEVLAVFHIALACTETDPELRPRMKTVTENLERVGN
ncbi:receptor protein kinase-like protein ZAR1 [Aristolochia californica]|uniref:receptor protein kinase-like protein ZAR1 n=1 Tax=Aristolochia californica TaxID=171875 RepID=UPI0035DC595B